jgi:anti-sigma regulatory factor (Ser/Thr protein kinase)
MTDFIRTLTPEACDYATLRRQFGDWLDRHDVAESTVADWRLILSELAANACEAAPPGGRISVGASLTDDRIELQVTNPIDGAPVLTPARAFDADSDRGRGLLIVDTISDGMECEVRPGSVSIRCWIARSAEHG